MIARAGTTLSSPPVVVAWEPSPAPAADHRAALAMLAQQLGDTVAGVLLPSAALEAMPSPELAALLRDRHLRAMPLVDLRDASANAAEAMARSLAALDAADVLLEIDGQRHVAVIADADDADADRLASMRHVLGSGGRKVQMGWLRRTSLFAPRPRATDYVIDHAPYGGLSLGASEAPRPYPYDMLVAELARLHAGDDTVAPGVLWSATRDAITDTGWRVHDVSDAKMRHAIDTARRFVLNRSGHGTPFWLLRMAFDPASPTVASALAGLRDILQRPHEPSATLPGVAEMPVPVRSGARIAVVLHLYYPDLWAELADAIARLPEAFDLFVSCPHRIANAMRARVRQRFPAAVVYGVQNLGRDVLPFLIWLRSEASAAYRYVLKLHGKKSVHILDAAQGPFGGGDTWRRHSIAGLVGTSTHAAAVLAALDAQREIGIVAPAGQLYDQVEWKCGTGDLVHSLLQRAGETPAVEGGFPAGTMFWARTEALARLRTFGDDMLDFEREAGQVDGTMHHAYERLIPLLATAAGFRTVDSQALLGAR